MCLAVPMKLIKKQGDVGTVELGGVERQISLMLMPDARLGEYMVVHAGFAIQRLDEEDAKETLDLLMQISDGELGNTSLGFTDKLNKHENNPEEKK